TSKELPFNDPGPDCKKVAFAGTGVRGGIEAIDAPHIEGTRTQAVHRVLQAVLAGSARTGELYDYSAQFGVYQVIVIANPLVVPGQPVAKVDTQRARDLLVKGVSAGRGPAGANVLGPACPIVRGHDPPITSRSPCASGSRNERPPPRRRNANVR